MASLCRATLPALPLLVLHACTPAANPLRESTVFFASGADLQSINPLVTVHPLAKQVQKNVLFLTLAAYDSLLQPVPRLASWSWSADRTTLTFALRRDVRWHDGVSTTAADVVWTLRAAQDPAVAYPRARDLDQVTGVDAPDSFTVRVLFARPRPTFPDVLTDLAILPAHRFRDIAGGAIRAAPFNQSPVGNGPFMFVEHRPNQRWLFRRNTGFPAELGQPSFERLVVVVVDEPSTKLAALTSGELDFAGINPAHAGFVRKDPRLAVRDYPILLSYALFWNLRREPFDDMRVRRALSLAINRPLIVDAYLYAYGRVADGPVPPEHPWHEPGSAPYEPDSARRLLDEAGWVMGSDGVRIKGGKRLAFEVLSVPTGDNPLEQMIQAQLRDVGAEVRIRLVELATFLGMAQGNERAFDALITAIPGDLSLGYVAALFDGRRPGPLAYSGYSNPDSDRALEHARAATSEAALADAWREVQRRVAADAPVAWLYHARGVQGVSRRIGDLSIDLRGEMAGIARWKIVEVP